MRIADIETIVVDLPRRASYGWRSLKDPIGRYVILRLTTEDGLAGLGEAPAILSWGGEHGRYFGEDPHIVRYLVGEVIAPLLRGADPREMKPLLAELDVRVRGYPYTKSMIECALLDILARSAGVPLHRFLGGAARTEIPICHSVGLAAPEDAARESEAAAADGIGWLQIKVAGDVRRDVEVVGAVRRAVGDEVRIYPDVNRGYRETKAAIGAIRAMRDEAGIVAVEQPVEGLAAMRQVVEGVDLPVIVDEGCWSPQDAIEVVKAGAADLLSIYYTKAAGLGRAMEIGAIARAAGLPSNVNGSLEAGVGNAANLHLAAALEGATWPAVITVNTLAGREQTRVGGVFYLDDVITEPFAYRDGRLAVPDGPGLGVELDPDKIAKYRVDS